MILLWSRKDVLLLCTYVLCLLLMWSIYYIHLLHTKKVCTNTICLQFELLELRRALSGSILTGNCSSRPNNEISAFKFWIVVLLTYRFQNQILSLPPVIYYLQHFLWNRSAKQEEWAQTALFTIQSWGPSSSTVEVYR